MTIFHSYVSLTEGTGYRPFDFPSYNWGNLPGRHAQAGDEREPGGVRYCTADKKGAFYHPLMAGE